MRQASLTVALVFLFTGVSALAEAQDPKQLEQSCNAGELKACVQLGEHYRLGELGLKRDRTLAMSLFERACNRGNPDGCYRLGTLFDFTVDPAEKDKARAVQLHQKACDMKHGGGCYRAGWAYAQGEGVSQDRKRALTLYEQACQLGESLGCEAAASFHHPKTGISPDVKRWATFMEKACDVGQQTMASLCFELGLHFDLGLWVPKDPDHANELFKKACLFGKEEACKLVVRKQHVDVVLRLRPHVSDRHAARFRSASNQRWTVTHMRSGPVGDAIRCSRLRRYPPGHG